MATVRRATAARADSVWAVLADGWRLASWVVGAVAEDVASGPARLVPARLRAAAIGARNVETLRRLALLAETRAP